MEQIRTEQPIAAKRRRGPGRPFKQSDPRINRGGVPSEVREFHNWMRQSFARFLQEGTKDGLTNGEHIIRTLIQKAKDGDMKAIEYVLDRMGGKPLQSVEVGTEFSFNFLTEADRIRAIESVKRIKQMQADGAARQLVGRAFTLAPPALECKTPTATAPVSVEENRVSVPSEKRRCMHGFPVHAKGATQCVICANIGLQLRD